MDGGVILAERLEMLLPGVATKRYRRLKFYDQGVHPVTPDLPAGVDVVTREAFTEVGDADFVSDQAVDIPIVDLGATETPYRAYMVASAYSYTFQQMRALTYANMETMIDRRKMLLAQRSIARRVNDFAAFGIPNTAVTGFLNHPVVDAAATNSSTDLYSETPDALASFFITAAGSIADESDGVYDGMKIALSRDLYRLLESTRMTDGTVNVLNYILENASETITEFVPLTETGTAKLTQFGVGETDKDRIVIYPDERVDGEYDQSMDMPDSPEIVERHVEPVQIAPEEFWQRANLRVAVPQFMVTTPTMINYPEAMAYIDVPKKS